MPNEVTIDITVTDDTGAGLASALAKVAAFRAKIDGMMKDVNVNVGVDTKGLAGAAATDAAINRIGQTATRTGRFLGILKNRSTDLFGGMPGWVPKIMGSVTAIHLLGDAIFETAAVVVPASIAVGAFGVAAADTVSEMITREKELITVNHALGPSVKEWGTQQYAADKTLRGLTQSMGKMQDTVKAQTFVLFGEGLYVASQKAGAFSQIITQTGNNLDTLGARTALALGGKGFSGLMGKSAEDVKILGNVVGNVFGTLGNLIRPLPGYAEMLASGLEHATGAIEHITSTSVFQGLEHVVLGFHGAWLYGGLAATVIGRLTSGSLGKLGGIALNAATGLERIAGKGNLASRGILSFAAGAEKASALPWGWIAGAAAAIGVLTYALVTSKDAIQSWGAALNDVLNKQPALKGYQLNIKDQALAAQKWNQALDQLNHTLKPSNQAMAEAGRAGGYLGLAYKHAQMNANDYHGILIGLIKSNQQYTQNLGIMGKSLGGTAQAQRLLTQTGITYGQVAHANKTQLAEIVLELQGYNLAIHQLAGYGGRYAAATNAMAFADGDLYKAAQQVAQAQDAVISTVTGGESAFYTYIETLKQTHLRAYSTSAGFKVLSDQAKKMNDFWQNLIPNSQQLIDKLNAQQISTDNLRKVVATLAKEDLVYAGHNQAARASVEALINNALGPGTVSFKNMRRWVNDNSTSLQGMNKIVGESTVKAGKLASVLENDLNAQFHADLLASSGASRDMKNFTDAVVNGGTKTQAYRTARHNLIQDLENTGMNAKQARTYVNNLQKQIDAMHGKTVPVGVHGEGSGGIVITGKGVHAQFHVGTTGLAGRAAGGMIEGKGTGTSDSNLIAVSRGEFVVNAASTAQHRPLLEAINSKKMANGGIVDMPGFVAGQLSADTANAERQFMASVMTQAAKAVSSSALGGDAAANRALARRLFPWPLAMWPAQDALTMRESGWSRFARNPSSGAYGIPQALPPTKLPFAGQAAGGSHAGPQIGWMYGYERGRYGNPLNAWAHEQQFGWYAKGGVVRGTLDEKIGRLIHFIHGRPDEMIRYNRLHAQYAHLGTLLHDERMLEKAGHGGPRVRSAIRHDIAERHHLRHELGPYERNRAWANYIEKNIHSRESRDAPLLAAARHAHLTGLARHYEHQMAADKAHAATISHWLDRTVSVHHAARERARDRREAAATERAADRIVAQAARALGLPVLSFDSGGLLPTGASLAINGTGRPEPVGAGAGGPVVLLVGTRGGQSTFDQFLFAWIQKNVRVKGGGDVQVAFGQSS